MKVTVCELSDDESRFVDDWHQLISHVEQQRPDLLLLPELPFCKWIAFDDTPTYAIKMQSVVKHERWIAEIDQLNVKLVIYSKPIVKGNHFYNSAFVFEKGKGHSKIHTKSLFPEEPFFWEQTWYDQEADTPFDILEIGGLKLGVLLCTEMWFTQHARKYGKMGIDLLLCPRATGMESVNQWVRCGQTLAVIAGAYCLSSNKTGPGEKNFQWGGSGWIAEPSDGSLLGTTSVKEKFITRTIDLDKSRNAKAEYPLYVKD